MPITKYLLFLCGQIGVMSLSRFLYQWILKYGDLESSGTELFPAITLGILFFSFRVFDGVTDPIAGRLTDSWVRKGFQRRTLLWFSFSLAPIGLALAFSANHSLSKPFATGAPLPMETAGMPESVANAVTRDYSDLMKAISRKKGN